MAKEKLRGDILTLKSFTEFFAGYVDTNRKRNLIIVTFLVVAVAALFLTLGIGEYKISISGAWNILVDHLSGNIVNTKDDFYIWDIRLPRAIGALFLGAGLAVGGVVMQNIMRNPLAEPYTVGISSGAFLGAVLSIVCGISIIPIFRGITATVVNAFLLSLMPMAIILVVSSYKKLTPTSIILLGIAIMYVFSSISQFIMVTAEPDALADAYNWRVGTLDKITWENLPPIVVATVVISALLFTMSKKLDVAYTGDRNAVTLGVNMKVLRLTSMTLVAFLTATLVCFTGTIGFIGLVGPHIARIFVGSNNRYLIPCSLVFGAAFMILADSVAKVSGVNGLPVGVISAMIGGPLFIYILIKQGKKVWN